LLAGAWPKGSSGPIVIDGILISNKAQDIPFWRELTMAYILFFPYHTLLVIVENH